MAVLFSAILNTRSQLAKAIPNQCVVSHPPSALILMLAGGKKGRQNHEFGRNWSSNLHVEPVQKLKCYTFLLCWYRWKYMRAEIKGDEQLIDLEWPKATHTVTVIY